VPRAATAALVGATRVGLATVRPACRAAAAPASASVAMVLTPSLVSLALASRVPVRGGIQGRRPRGWWLQGRGGEVGGRLTGEGRRER
jgi:hypothetical protein